MKTLVLLATVLSAPLAHADFTSDVAGKSVRCTGNQTIVVLDKGRKEIMVIDAIDPGHPEKYKITKRESDGDTYVSYKSKEATIYLDDRGDELVYADGTKLALRCSN